MSCIALSSLYLLILLPSMLSIQTDYTIFSTKIYPYMQISMDILITKTPLTLNYSQIFSIDKFLSIHITSNDILQIQIQNNAINNHPIHVNTIYTLNITLNPSHNYYSLHTCTQSISSNNSNIQIYSFIIIPSPLQYKTSHPLIIHDKCAQITNLWITTDESESNGYILYSSAITNNRIFANIDNNQSITPSPTMQDKYESIFGSNVTKTEEIIYVAIILVAIICMLSVVAYATVRKCNRRNKRYDKQSSYEKVNPYSVVSYVDEAPGNKDVNKLKDAQISLTQKKSFNEKYKKNNERKEGEDNADFTDVGINTTTATTNLIPTTATGTTSGNDMDDKYMLTPTTQKVYVEREDSISAMSI